MLVFIPPDCMKCQKIFSNEVTLSFYNVAFTYSSFYKADYLIHSHDFGFNNPLIS